MSTGERQRLALLRAILLHPGVLLLDEPCSALDETSTGRIERVLQALQTRGTAIVLVSHDMRQAGRMSACSHPFQKQNRPDALSFCFRRASCYRTVMQKGRNEFCFAAEFMLNFKQTVSRSSAAPGAKAVNHVLARRSRCNGLPRW
ncbi:ATP-binding cassette domain-containing protein [Komagataeibacter rhaeticus]|uniref:ATP-binding cassette domain-containing protein n=1 Tax=Komagataeibacter rhaeticus TaxID=215221 RepID=UPI001CC2AF7D|nr:ATP-binding cassette domain-containing protein [Komagataeibacter rhaeticus]